MAYKLLENCPVCSHRLHAVKLKCSSCGTVIENEFELSGFSRLSKEQLGFLEVFIACRGSIKDVERALGISYPTVRAKLDDVIGMLGLKVAEQEPGEEVSKREVLKRLDAGEITQEEALRAIKTGRYEKKGGAENEG